jgi:hypothetical protein
VASNLPRVEQATLTGKVLDATTKSGISGVKVEIWGGPDRNLLLGKADTTADGVFKVRIGEYESNPGAIYIIKAIKEGYNDYSGFAIYGGGDNPLPSVMMRPSQ